VSSMTCLGFGSEVGGREPKVVKWRSSSLETLGVWGYGVIVLGDGRGRSRFRAIPTHDDETAMSGAPGVRTPYRYRSPVTRKQFALPLKW
jgi:hypothetical protein